MKKVFLKISQNSQGNTCVRVSFLIKLQASGTGFFLWVLRNVKKHLFYRTPADDLFWISNKKKCTLIWFGGEVMVNLFFIKYTYPKFHPIRHVTLTHTNAKLLLVIVFALVFIVIVFRPKRALNGFLHPVCLTFLLTFFHLCWMTLRRGNTWDGFQTDKSFNRREHWFSAFIIHSIISRNKWVVIFQIQCSQRACS